MKVPRIRAGVGGWTYEPWRETFYPSDLPKARELHYASRQLTAIEVNGTFYRLQKPETFAKWRDETPQDFIFSLKAPRYIVNRKALAEAGQYIERFLHSGLSELGEKLGPILWQLAPDYFFERTDLEPFLDALPADLNGLQLRHALEVRHETFQCEEFLDVARRRGIAAVFTDSAKQPSFADATAQFIYARLKRSSASIVTGYSNTDLEQWAARARLWAQGGEPDDLPRIERTQGPSGPRDVFVFFIDGAKERAPAAALALLSLLRTWAA